jgi:hypothetical protein
MMVVFVEECLSGEGMLIEGVRIQIMYVLPLKEVASLESASNVGFQIGPVLVDYVHGRPEE